MAYILRQILGGYNYLFEDLCDPRTKDLPLAGKPVPMITVLALYQMFVFYLGPKLMKNRRPLNIDKIIMVYNIIQVILCSYVFFKGLILYSNYKLICEPIGSSSSEHALSTIKVIYTYYIIKFLDLLDTVFFVLRKKDNQISFLHVYHHTLTVVMGYVAITYLPGGHGSSVGITNSFVHMIMYSYYFSTLAVPDIKKSLWWKKYITQVQIVQFLINILHIGSILFVRDCGYPKWMAFLFLPNNFFMLILFVDFYIKNYIKKPKQN